MRVSVVEPSMLLRRHMRFRVRSWIARTSLVALALAACKSDPPPAADWARSWSAWDHEKWQHACGEEKKDEAGIRVSWSTYQLDSLPKRSRSCAAHVIDGIVRSFSIRVESLPGETFDDLKMPLAGLVDELPSDVGRVLMRLVDEKLRSGNPSSVALSVRNEAVGWGRDYRGFRLEVEHDRSDLGADYIATGITVLHPARFE